MENQKSLSVLISVEEMPDPAGTSNRWNSDLRVPKFQIATVAKLKRRKRTLIPLARNASNGETNKL